MALFREEWITKGVKEENLEEVSKFSRVVGYEESDMLEKGSSYESAVGHGLHFEIAVFLFLVNLGESSCSFLIPSNRVDVN